MIHGAGFSWEKENEKDGRKWNFMIAYRLPFTLIMTSDGCLLIY